jgi:hypothetical protein
MGVTWSYGRQLVAVSAQLRATLIALAVKRLEGPFASRPAILLNFLVTLRSSQAAVKLEADIKN